jgi:hypothetical protein
VPADFKKTLKTRKTEISFLVDFRYNQDGQRGFRVGVFS